MRTIPRRVRSGRRVLTALPMLPPRAGGTTSARRPTYSCPRLARVSSTARDFHAGGKGQVRLMNPAARIGRTVPTLQGDGGDVFTFFFVEDFLKRGRETGPHLSRGPSDEKQAIIPIIKHGHSPPALGLRFGGVKHGTTLLGLRKGKRFA